MHPVMKDKRIGGPGSLPSMCMELTKKESTTLDEILIVFYSVW
jgi:hypothetical protein